MPTIKKRGNADTRQQEQEIVTLAHKVNTYIENYRQPLAIILAAVAVIVVVWGGYSFFRSQKERKASPLVAAAYEFYKPPIGTPPDYGKAIALFREVNAKYPGTTNGAIALFYAANCLADTGKTDDAVKTYQEFTKEYGRETFLLGLVYQRLGYAYIQMGKAEDSKKAFEQAETLLGPGAATVELARLYQVTGNQLESEKRLKTVVDKLAGTSWAMDALARVQKAQQTPLPAREGTAK